MLPPSNVRQSDPFGPGRRWAAEAQECPWRCQATDSAGLQQHTGPLARRGNGSRWGDGVGIGRLLPLWPWGPLPLRCFGTQTGTQDSRVLEKMPCHFLLSEGRRERGAQKGIYQTGETGRPWGRHVQGTVLSPAAGSSWPRGPHAGAQGLWDGKASGVLPCPSPPPRAGDGGVGVQAEATGEMWGAGQDPAVASRAARGLPGRPRPRSSVLRGPHKPPCLQLPSVPLSLRPQWAGRSSEDALSPALPSSWLLEGQAPAAWVLLELDLLQGEDGGSVWELVHTLPQGPEVGVVQGCLC